MKETFVDPATGWIVARQTVTRCGVELIEETVTDPQTGEVHQGGLRSPSIPRDLGAWVQGIISQRERNERPRNEWPLKLVRIGGGKAGQCGRATGVLGAVEGQ